MSETKAFQIELFQRLNNKFKDCLIEWRTFSNYIHYSPRVDVAVGPYSTPEFGNQGDIINQVYLTNEQWIQELFNFHQENMAGYLNEYQLPDFHEIIHFNRNPRCFLAIEIENKTSKKHILGSVVNASSLGKIGIGIPMHDSTFRTFARILNYLSFLKNVGKNTFHTNNFLLLKREQVLSTLPRFDNAQANELAMPIRLGSNE
jgi:hypothetical protein